MDLWWIFLRGLGLGYDERILVYKGEIIVVIVNYRLGDFNKIVLFL